MCFAVCFFFARCHPPFPRFCLSVFVCISFSFCVPSFWGMSSCCSSFYMLETLSICLSVSLSFYFLACHPQQVPDAFFTNSTCFSRLFLKGFFFYQKMDGDEERHAGWFPFATYLQVMGSRKSDPREFIMRITNPLCELKHFPLLSLGGSRGVSMTVWIPQCVEVELNAWGTEPLVAANKLK